MSNDIEQNWEKVGQLSPKLRQHVQFYRHSYRGQSWYVLNDEMSANHFRCPENVYAFVMLLDGTRSISEAYETLCVKNNDQHADTHGTQSADPSHWEILRLLTFLEQADLLQGNIPIDTENLVQRAEKKRQQDWQQRLMRPLALKFPLIDPDKLLSASADAVKPLFSSAGFALWMFLVALGFFQAISHWGEINNHWQSRFIDPQNLFLLLFLYPLIKGIHELGHAYACKKWGGEVHEMGIMLLVFMPVPYVDASSSTRFYHKHQRMLVAAAGIMVESFVAALGVLVFLSTEAGISRDIAFNFMVIGGLSTLLFNGNPLLRFDGYYILADAVEIPNLATRSNQYLGYLLKRYVLNFDNAVSPVTARGEAPWMLFYGLLAGIYRLFISCTIALYVAGKLFFLGLALGLWVVLGQIMLPTTRNLVNLAKSSYQQNRQYRFIGVSSISASVVIACLFFLPISQSTYVEGIFRLPEQSIIRAQSDGFLFDVHQTNGIVVNAGEPLFQLTNPELMSELAVLEAKSQELDALYSEAMVTDTALANSLKTEAKSLAAELGEVQQKIAALSVKSATKGVFSVTHGNDLPGRFYRKGDIMAYVTNQRKINARVVASQEDVSRINNNTQRILVRSYGNPGKSIEAKLLGGVPLATHELPSALLGTQGGGRIAVDARDKKGTRAISSIFQYDIELPEKDDVSYIGRRVAVRFIHSDASIAQSIYASARQLLLSKFQF